MLGAAANVAMESRRPVLFFSMEMGAVELTKRMLASESRVDARKLQTGKLTDGDWTRLNTAISHLGEAPLFIDDNAHCTVMEMRAKARRIKARYGDLGLIVVDYLQLMSSPRRAENRQVEVSEMSRGLKILARELDCPVMVGSQLNRQLEYRQDKRPMLADLRESGSIEQDADVVLFLYRDDVYNPESDQRGIAEVIIGKHRNGPTGVAKLAFLDHIVKFANMAETPDGTPETSAAQPLGDPTVRLAIRVAAPQDRGVQDLRGHDPGGGVQADAVAVVVGRERVAHAGEGGVDDVGGASLSRVRPMPVLRRNVTACSTLPHPPSRSDASNGVDRHVGEPGRVEDAADEVGVAERERAGRAGRRRLRERHVLGHRERRDRHPLVHEQRLPAHEREPAAGCDRAVQVGERGDRVVEEHHAEAAEQQVGPGRDRVHLRVADLEGDVGRRPRARRAGGRPRSSGAEMSMPVVTPRAASRAAASVVAPVPQPDVEHGRVGRGRGGVEERGRERREHLVVARLVGDPDRALVRVPVLPLLGVGALVAHAGRDQSRFGAAGGITNPGFGRQPDARRSSFTWAMLSRSSS